MDQTLKDLIGQTTANHAVVVVKPGKIYEAVDFFVKELGWTELRQTGPQLWGQAGFVRDGGGFIVQLTEPARSLGRRLKYVHLALRVRDPSFAALAMAKWGNERNLRVTSESVEGGKWFVKLAGLFSMDIELVPTDS